ncbi:hypothetical protein BBP40_001161 [Aspergillus hancockii]|nr:hypothetical protein BBP40_001161 [Aspergillus hancockii]
MPLRRPHKKSHHGCVQCKQRRIKCDESRPNCGSCQRKRLVCTFKSEPPLLAHPASPSPGVLPAPPLPLLELELLHHWHTVAGASLALNETVQDLFRVTVPGLALSHPFLMHGLLAVSALHISQKCPAERRPKYTEVAISHNNLALSLCPSLLSNVTPENCHALFAFSCLVAIFAFATQGPAASPTTLSIADVVKIFGLIRGVKSIVEEARSWIQQGEMRPLLRMPGNQRQDSKGKPTLEAFTRIQQLVEEQVSLEPALHGSNDGPVISAALEQLTGILELCTTLDNPGAIMAWPVLVDAEYLALLLQEEPTSLVIIGYYGAALNLLSNEWWLDGWGEFLVKLALDRLGTTAKWKMERCLEIVRVMDQR